jgi:excisionase family DNA binding protein
VAEKDQFYSFEEALKELRLKEEELKRLVSEGEIRAFREGDTMRLRRADVENLRNELTGGEVVDLGDIKEDLVFEDDLVEDTGMATQEIGLSTEEISNVETIVDDVEEVREVELESDALSMFDEAEEDLAASPVVTQRVTRVEIPEEYEGGGMRTLLVVTSLILIFALPLVLSMTSPTISAVARKFAGIFS